MTTSRSGDSRVDDTRVPERTLWFYRGRLQERLHDLISDEFYRQQDAGLITQTALAHRLGRRKEQISRWLAEPTNWTLDTISDLLVGLRIPPVVTIEGLPVQPVTLESTVAEMPRAPVTPPGGNVAYLQRLQIQERAGDISRALTPQGRKATVIPFPFRAARDKQPEWSQQPAVA